MTEDTSTKKPVDRGRTDPYREAITDEDVRGPEQVDLSSSPDRAPEIPLETPDIPQSPSAGLEAALEEMKPEEGEVETSPVSEPLVIPEEEEARIIEEVSENALLGNEVGAEEDGADARPQFINPIPHIRTFESDAAQAMREQQATIAKVRVMEAEKKHDGRIQSKPKTKSTRNTFNVVLIIILMMMTAGLLGYATFWRPNTSERGFIVTPDEIIFAEGRTEIEEQRLEGGLPDELARLALNKEVSLGGVESVYLTFGSGTVKYVASAEEFMRLLGVAAPASLVRTFTDDYMYGLHRANNSNHNEPFLIFKINSFDRAFAGMLDWEKTLESDFGFMIKEAATETSLNDLGTSTSEEITGFGNWRDRVIQNLDVRYLPGDRERTRLLYSLIDRETLIITTNEATFEEVLARLNRARFTR